MLQLYQKTRISCSILAITHWVEALPFNSHFATNKCEIPEHIGKPDDFFFPMS